MIRRRPCEFCVSAQPSVASPRSRRLKRQVSVCWRHRGHARAMTRQQRQTVARRGIELAAGVA